MKKNPLYKNKYVYVALLLVAAVAVAVFALNRNQDPTKSYSPQYPESVKNSDNNQDKEDSVKDSNDSDLPETSEEVPVSQSGSIEITTLNQQNGFVNASATVANFSVTTCTYMFTSDGARPISRETQGSCNGVSIPQAEFDKIGLYKLEVTAYSNDQKISTTKTIDVK